MKHIKTILIILVSVPVVVLLWSGGRSILNWRLFKFEKVSEYGSTLSSFEANRIANSIEVAVDRFGTDSDTINDLLLSLSVADVRKVFNEWGRRWYYNIPWETYGWSRNLLEVLEFENQGELDEVVNYVVFSLGK